MMNMEMKEITELVEEGRKFRRMKRKSKGKIRKHRWLPCLLSQESDIDAMSEEEYHQLLKDTQWLDNITDAEYRYLFNPKELSKSYTYTVRSRLKKKIRQWLMCLSTLWAFEPELCHKAKEEAKQKYEQQTGRPLFLK